MSKLTDVIQKGIELNYAIENLMQETKTLNSITGEKRNAKLEEIIQDISKYEEIMHKLNINTIDFSTKTCMFYYGLIRQMGIKLHTWTYKGKAAMQIDLGVYATVQNGFYAMHSIGIVACGMRNEEILNGFCECWSGIRNNIEESFATAVEDILQKRKDKAIKDREIAITNLTSIR